MKFQFFGAGIGLRQEHLDDALSGKVQCGWYEIITEDFLTSSASVIEKLKALKSQVPIIPHGVGLSVGSSAPLNRGQLKRIKTFLDAIDAPWYSDHLCFSMVDHANLEKLIPVPFTPESLRHIAARIKIIQEELARPLLLENVCRTLAVTHDNLTEQEFVAELLNKSDSYLLLDIGNVIENAPALNLSPEKFMKSLPLERVKQIHIPSRDSSIGDSNQVPTSSESWDLLKSTLNQTGKNTVLVEWDKFVPPWSQLVDEAAAVNALLNNYQ